jgi:hypothetical protein
MDRSPPRKQVKAAPSSLLRCGLKSGHRNNYFMPFTGNAPGGPSRWSTERSTQWEPLEPKLVVEVEYDHFTGGRFRHGTRLIRWRTDKAPRQCRMDQVSKVGSGSLKLLKTSAKP